jgi:penicillin-binding protein 1A
MVETGTVTPAEAKLANGVPLPTKLSYPVSRSLDYYIDEVKNRLLNDDPAIAGEPAEVLGSNQQARAKALYRDGLRIYTEYDPFYQRYASDAVTETLPPSEFTASLVVVDNANGGVRAIANGRTFAEMQFNPATEATRQAGSAFKVFTAAAALSRGYSPNDAVAAYSLRWRLGPGEGPDSFYELSGRSDDCYGGTPSLYRALAASDNCAWMRTELSLGPGNFGSDGVKQVVDMARNMGIDSAAKYATNVVSTTLGTQPVNPLEMAQAYSVFANDGVLKRARFVTKIVDASGKTIYQNGDAGRQVLDPNVARSVTDMMRGVVRSGTASRTLGGFPRPAAGKTGTTDNNYDAWFVGFVPQFTAAVWMGHPKENKAMRGLPVGPVFGATYPAQIWRRFMEKAIETVPEADFAPPDQSLWPRPSYINEFGRRVTISAPPVTTAPPAPTTAPPTTVTPTTRRPTPTTKPSATTVPAPTTTVAGP